MILGSHATSHLRAAYDPTTRTPILRADASTYDLAHERAHEQQQDRRTAAWRLHERLHRVPLLGRISLLVLEIEAARMAKRTLIGLGLWTRHCRADARAGLLSYVRALWPDGRTEIRVSKGVRIVACLRLPNPLQSL